MEILSFDISGKFAHFRKYYANNTAMSYALPPRTTIMGMLAAILGLPRDSYYETLNTQKIRLGIRIVNPIKKSFHRVNLLKIESHSDFRGKKGRVQIPTELVSGIDIRKDSVVYRIYVSFFSEGKEVFEDLRLCLEKRRQVYNLTLGSANYSASVNNFKQYTIEEKEAFGENLNFDSAVLTESVSGLNNTSDTRILLEEEMLPADFVSDFDRELSKLQRVLFTTDGNALPIKFTGKYCILEQGDKNEIITFLD